MKNKSNYSVNSNSNKQGTGNSNKVRTDFFRESTTAHPLALTCFSDVPTQCFRPFTLSCGVGAPFHNTGTRICVQHWCFLFSRNIRYVTPKFIYFHDLSNIWIIVPKKTFCLLLKTEAEASTMYILCLWSMLFKYICILFISATFHQSTRYPKFEK